VALAGGVALQLALQYRLNYWSRDFFDAFGRRDAAALRNEALLFLLLAGLSILAAIFSIWARMTMQRKWRAWLTRTLLDRWLAKDRINQLQFDQGEDRNPEFRIAEDARVATQAPVDLAASFLTAFLSAVIFISVLWNVGGDLTVQIDGHALTVPKYLVITVAIYSAVLTLGMMTIGRRMVSVIAGKNASEAQFRSVASHVRERGASALAGDRPAEHKRVSGSFDSLIVHWRDLCHQVMRTTLVSTGNILVAPVIGWVLCAPKYLEGTMSLGEVAQAVAAFVMVQSALNWLVDNYPGLAECMSSVNRVAALLQALDKTEEEHDVPVLDRGQYDTRQPNPEPVKQPALAGR
jgi:putative ATP-binding cassette transporter